MSNVASDALFILLVEKDAAFMRLAEDRFYQTYPCIILTAKGQPDVASRSSPLPLFPTKPTFTSVTLLSHSSPSPHAFAASTRHGGQRVSGSAHHALSKRLWSHSAQKHAGHIFQFQAGVGYHVISPKGPSAIV